MLNEPSFKEAHRTEARYFSRERVLNFVVVVLLIMRKSAKSLQLVLNEFLGQAALPLVSKSAFTQARSHLKHTAFIELNQKAIVEVCYGDGEYQRFWGFRLLGIDGSKVILPDTEAIYAEFGSVKRPSGRKGQAGQGRYSYSLVSVLYDVLNDISLDSRLAGVGAYEVDLAEQHLPYTQEGDLLLQDRNFPSYRWLATLKKANRHFVIRCSRSSFAQARSMFEGQGPDSQIVTLKASPQKLKEIRRRGLPEQIQVRLVRLNLPNGEIEILMTDLLDESLYPTAEFGGLYRLRWGIETFYGRLKTRLGLENFSGLTPEAIKQDFYATIFITGLESLLTETAQAKLQDRSSQTHHAYQVNKAVSFNAIKTHVLALFYQESDLNLLLLELTRLFMTDPTCVRKERLVPRVKTSFYHLFTFHKRKKKSQ